MKRPLLLAAAAAATLFAASAAEASRVSWSIGVNVPPVATYVSSGPAWRHGAAALRAAAVVYAPAPFYAPRAVVSRARAGLLRDARVRRAVRQARVGFYAGAGRTSRRAVTYWPRRRCRACRRCRGRRGTATTAGITRSATAAEPLALDVLSAAQEPARREQRSHSWSPVGAERAAILAPSAPVGAAETRMRGSVDRARGRTSHGAGRGAARRLRFAASARPAPVDRSPRRRRARRRRRRARAARAPSRRAGAGDRHRRCGPSPPVVVTPLPAPTVPAAVAARFPEPAVTFATPAFEPGRTHIHEQRRAARDRPRARAQRRDRRARAATVSRLPLGVSQRGAPIEALAFTRPAPPGGRRHRRRRGGAPRRPTVVIIAAQHGDEPAGTEALIVVAQELAAGRLARRARPRRRRPPAARQSRRRRGVHARRRRRHRRQSRPPAAADAGSARDRASCCASVAPLVVLDLHEYPVGGAFTTKFGGVQRFDALLQYATTANLAPFVTKAAEEWFRQPLLAGLRSAGLSVDWYATVSADPADRTLTMGSVAPQVGRNASGLRNAVSLLVETRGGGIGRVDLKRRVQAQRGGRDERARERGAARRRSRQAAPVRRSRDASLRLPGPGRPRGGADAERIHLRDARPGERRDPPHDGSIIA